MLMKRSAIAEREREREREREYEYEHIRTNMNTSVWNIKRQQILVISLQQKKSAVFCC